MIKISEVVKEIVSENTHLSFGLGNGLFNLSQLAKFLQPMVEVRLQKPVKSSAILMNLSRLQRQRQFKRKKFQEMVIENITIQSNLVTMTFYKNDNTEKEIDAFHQAIRERNGYFGFMEGMNEYTIVFEQRLGRELLGKYIKELPKYENDTIAALVIKYPKSYATQAGFLYSVLRALALQNINVIEAASTYSEFTIYIDKVDIQLAFDVLERSFD